MRMIRVGGNKRSRPLQIQHGLTRELFVSVILFTDLLRSFAKLHVPVRQTAILKLDEIFEMRLLTLKSKKIPTKSHRRSLNLCVQRSFDENGVWITKRFVQTRKGGPNFRIHLAVNTCNHEDLIAPSAAALNASIFQSLILSIQRCLWLSRQLILRYHR